MSDAVNVPVGSIWRENDKRFERYVKVISIAGPDRVMIVGCSQEGHHSAWFRGRSAKVSRFGKAYKLVESTS